MAFGDKPYQDQYYPGGVVNLNLDWNVGQHNQIVAGAGNLVQVGAATASNSPSLVINNIPTYYSVYILELLNLVSTQDPYSGQGGDPHLQFSIDNGNSFDAGSHNYSWFNMGYLKYQSSNIFNYSDGGDPVLTTYIALSSNGTSVSIADGGYSGTVRMYNLTSGTMNKNLVFSGAIGGTPSYSYRGMMTGGGAYMVPTNAVNALQVVMGNTGTQTSIDTIVAGQIKLYGVV